MYIYISIYVCIYIYMCGNRIKLVYNSEFLAFLQLSGMQFYFYLPKYKQLYTFTISKYKM